MVIPSYNEQENIVKAADEVTQLLESNNIAYELIFVNDGSTDKSWEIISGLVKLRKNIVGVDLSRNFGKESAIFAGLEIAKGDACVLLDCDLQFPPEVIIDMYNIWKNNDVDIVEGRKQSRGKENVVYKGFSHLFYKMINRASGLDLNAASDFKLMDRAVVDSLNAMPERLTFFRAMSSWVGFKTERVYFDVRDRNAGQSKWTAGKLIRFAMNNITSFTSAPLQLVTICGVITMIISVIMGVNTLYNKFFGDASAGFSTVIILQLFTSSIIMFSLGIIGFYIAKIYEEIKRRPRYIIKQIVRKDQFNGGGQVWKK